MQREYGLWLYLTKVISFASYEYRQRARLASKPSSTVGVRLSLLERLAHIVKATGNRDNLMGLYLSGGGGRRETVVMKETEAREADGSQREVQRATANLPVEIKPARKRNWNWDENYGSHVPHREGPLDLPAPRPRETKGLLSKCGKLKMQWSIFRLAHLTHPYDYLPRREIITQMKRSISPIVLNLDFVLTILRDILS